MNVVGLAGLSWLLGGVVVLLQVMGGVWAGGVYCPGSAGGGVGVEVEEFVEAFLGGVEVGEDAAGSGAAFAFAGVEHGDLVDAVEVA